MKDTLLRPSADSGQDTGWCFTSCHYFTDCASLILTTLKLLASSVGKLAFTVAAGRTLEDGPSSSPDSERSYTKAETPQSEQLQWIVKGIC